MPTISHKLSERAQIILLVLFDAAQKVNLFSLNQFLKFSSPMMSGDYKKALKFYSEFNILTLRLKRDEEIKLVRKDLSGLEYMGLITITEVIDDTKDKEDNVYIKLTAEGKRIAEALSKGRNTILRPKALSLKSVFIACAFGYSDVDELYNLHFLPSCKNLGYEAIRVDMTEPHQTITEKIMSGINEAACIIADLTYARPSVYFEIGYAVGLGIPLVTTCRQDHFRGEGDDQRVHFDLQQYKISFWEKNQDGSFKWPSEAMEPGKRLTSILQSRK